jgi:Domain of unknown function (DUF1992)
MSLNHVDFRNAMRRLADRRIEEAIRMGKFDNLPGRGKEINLADLPPFEDDRLAWLRMFSQNPKR